MKVTVYFCGNEDYTFDTDDQNDQDKVKMMVAALNDPENDTTEYYDENGNYILHWPLKDNSQDNMEDEAGEYLRMGIDYSPSCPWNAPGMSVSDFI